MHEHIVDLALGTAGARVAAPGFDEALAAHRRNLLAASADDIAACEATRTSAFTACALRVNTLDDLDGCEATGSRGAEEL